MYCTSEAIKSPQSSEFRAEQSQNAAFYLPTDPKLKWNVINVCLFSLSERKRKRERERERESEYGKRVKIVNWR